MIAIGNYIGKKRSFSWQSYWTKRFDFFYIGGLSGDNLDDITSNNYDIAITGKDFTGDYIPYTSTATFQAPDNATLKADDTDYLWFDRNGVVRNVEVSELVGYDFARTIVKYDNSAPYHIRFMGILKVGITLTAAEIDKMHTDFELALFWSGVENIYGRIKSNRALVQKLWTPEADFDARALELFANCLAEGEEVEYARKVKINTAIVALKAAGLFDTKFDCLWVLWGKGEWTTKMNWIKDFHNLGAMANGGTLTFTEDSGYQTDGTKSFLRTNYVPGTDGSKLVQDDASVGVKIAGTVVYDAAHGILGATSVAPTASYINIYNNSTTGARQRINYAGSNNTTNQYQVGYNSVSRPDNDKIITYRNDDTKTQTGLASTYVPTQEMTLLCLSVGVGSPSGWANSTSILQLAWAGAHLTQTEYDNLRTIMDTYMS